MKRIVIPWGKLGEGISLVGGRGRGLFFHTAKADNRGLQDGDQLIKVCSRKLTLINNLNSKTVLLRLVLWLLAE